MDGSDQLKPIVIGKYQNPRCMKNVDRSKLGCEYYATHKTWITSELFQRIIRDLNSRCKKQSRRCVFLVDGAGLRTEKCRSYILLIVFVSGAHCAGNHALEEGFELTLSNLQMILSRSMMMSSVPCIGSLFFISCFTVYLAALFPGSVLLGNFVTTFR